MRNCAGQGLVEYALVLPVFLLITFGIMEFGFLFLQYSTIANAAREGARTGILPVTQACNQACVDGRARAAALALTTGLDPAGLTVDVSHPQPNTVRVAVSYDASLMTGPVIQAVGGNPEIVLQSTATMNRE